MIMIGGVVLLERLNGKAIENAGIVELIGMRNDLLIIFRVLRYSPVFPVIPKEPRPMIGRRI